MRVGFETYEAPLKDEELAKWEKTKAKLEKELGPDFDAIPPDELLKIAASNSFHNGRALKEVRYSILILAAMCLAIIYKVFGLESFKGFLW